MPSILSTLVSFAALSTCVLGIDIYSYINKDCDGPAFYFKDLQPKVCALTIPRVNTTAKEAIALNLTTVHSGKIILNETELCDDKPKSFVGWDQGPKNNKDGLLQCGNVVNTKTPKKEETCMSVPASGFTGFSWTLKKDKPSKGDISEPTKRHTEVDPHDGIIDHEIEPCTESAIAEVLIISGTHYYILGLVHGELVELLGVAVKGDVVPSKFDKFKLN